MKKKLIFMILFCTISGALGSVAGWFLGGMFKITPDITNKEYVDGVIEYSKNNDIVKKILNASGVENEEDIENIDLVKLLDDKKVRLGDVAEYVEYLIHKNPYLMVKGQNLSLSESFGVKNTQYTYTCWVKHENLFFKENISFSQNAEFAERIYNFDSTNNTSSFILPKPFDNKIEYYRTNQNDGLNVDYTNFSANTRKEVYYINSPDESIKSFSTTFGLSLFNPFNYDAKEENMLLEEENYKALEIKNSKTNEDELYEPKLETSDAGYTLAITVDPKAAENYGSYIFTTTRDAAAIAKMKEKPTFEKIGVRFNLNKKLEIQSIHIDEFYQVVSSIVGNVPTICSSDLSFIYNKDEISIPNCEEKIDYGTN